MTAHCAPFFHRPVALTLPNQQYNHRDIPSRSTRVDSGSTAWQVPFSHDPAAQQHHSPLRVGQQGTPSSHCFPALAQPREPEMVDTVKPLAEPTAPQYG